MNYNKKYYKYKKKYISLKNTHEQYGGNHNLLFDSKAHNSTCNIRFISERLDNYISEFLNKSDKEKTSILNETASLLSQNNISKKESFIFFTEMVEKKLSNIYKKTKNNELIESNMGIDINTIKKKLHENNIRWSDDSFDKTFNNPELIYRSYYNWSTYKTDNKYIKSYFLDTSDADRFWDDFNKIVNEIKNQSLASNVGIALPIRDIVGMKGSDDNIIISIITDYSKDFTSIQKWKSDKNVIDINVINKLEELFNKLHSLGIFYGFEEWELYQKIMISNDDKNIYFNDFSESYSYEYKRDVENNRLRRQLDNDRKNEKGLVKNLEKLNDEIISKTIVLKLIENNELIV